MRRDYRYEVVESRFHGHVHIAYATSLETAVRSAKRHDTCTGRYCRCGGPDILNADGTELSDADYKKMRDMYWEMSQGW